jgi:hypothetical protein
MTKTACRSKCLEFRTLNIGIYLLFGVLFMNVFDIVAQTLDFIDKHYVGKHNGSNSILAGQSGWASRKCALIPDQNKACPVFSQEALFDGI